MAKSKSTHAGRMAVLDFLREEGIQIVPVPHGDRKTGGQIVVMLGDGTWLEFDTQKQVVDWLAEHMERRGVKVHNPIVYGLSLSDVRPGDRIKFRLPERRGIPSTTKTGTVRIVNDGSVVVDGGGRHGTPYVVTDHNYLGKMRGKVRSNPSNVSNGPYTYLKGDDGEYHLAVLLGAWKGATQYDRLERAIRGKGPYPTATMASLEVQSLNRKHQKSRSTVSDLTAAGMHGHDSSPWGADASRQRARRNPSSGKAFWWLIITRDDATAIGHRYESREDMMKYSKRHAANLRGDNSKALIRGTEPMTTADFRKAFKTAYPKFTLEV